MPEFSKAEMFAWLPVMANAKAKAAITIKAIINDSKNRPKQNFLFKKNSVANLGFSKMTSWRYFSNPNEIAGHESVNKFKNNSCKAVKGEIIICNAKEIMVSTVQIKTVAKFPVNKNRIAALILL